MPLKSSSLVIPAYLDRVAHARRWASQRAREEGCSQEVLTSLELAIAEALANVIEHSYEGEGPTEIHLTLDIDDKTLTLTIRDFGKKFDPSTYEPPDLAQPSEGGYGVFLIREVMDEVVYDGSFESGGRLTLVKYREDTKSGDVSGK